MASMETPALTPPVQGMSSPEVPSVLPRKRSICWPCLVTRTLIWAVVVFLILSLLMPWLGVPDLWSRLAVTIVVLAGVTVLDLRLIAPRSAKPSA